MRVFNVQPAARPVPSDRNAINKTQYANNAGIAPHGVTTRWTYTVPANKKATWRSGRAYNVRRTAAAPVGEFYSSLQYTPSGGSVTVPVVAISSDNTLLVYRNDEQFPQVDMLSGDALAGVDSDASTGGTADFVVGAIIFEYDA